MEKEIDVLSLCKMPAMISIAQLSTLYVKTILTIYRIVSQHLRTLLITGLMQTPYSRYTRKAFVTQFDLSVEYIFRHSLDTGSRGRQLYLTVVIRRTGSQRDNPVLT